jgi:hypothetical protein
MVAGLAPKDANSALGKIRTVMRIVSKLSGLDTIHGFDAGCDKKPLIAGSKLPMSRYRRQPQNGALYTKIDPIAGGFANEFPFGTLDSHAIGSLPL